MEGVGKAAQTEGVHGGDLQGGGEASCPGDRLVLVAGSCSPPWELLVALLRRRRVGEQDAWPGIFWQSESVTRIIFFFVVRVLFSAFL